MYAKNIVVICVFWVSLISSHIVFSDVSDPYLDDISQYFESINQLNNPELKYFLADMPKGGDLHNHLAGAAYPEWLISYTKFDPQIDWCVYAPDYTAKNDPGCVSNNGTLLQTLPENSPEYNAIVESWSMKGQSYNPKDPMASHDHFFNAFRKFTELTEYYPVRILASLMNQAAENKLDYLELMVRTDNDLAEEYAQKYITNLPNDPNQVTDKDIDNAIDQLEQHDFTTNVVKNTVIQNTQQLLADAYSLTGCKQLNPPLACNIKIKFQYTANRKKPYAVVLAGLYAGFIATNLAPDLFIGVNLIGLEDGDGDNIRALKNYNAEMRLVNHLKKRFSNNRPCVALHAGELTDRLTNIKKYKFELTYHINNATNVARADRIGHGIDLFCEMPYYPGLVSSMKNNTVAEICLTSNEQILGVCDGESYCQPPVTPYNPPDNYKFNHPFYYYFNSSVPVVLATDDQGVEQTDIVNEYYKASRRYPLTYQQLKDIDRNSLAYSFLPGKQLWVKKDDYIHFVPQCAKDNPYYEQPVSTDCQKYLEANLRAQAEWDLEKAFAQFEVGATPISNCKELQNISQNLNGSYRIIKDIDCSDTKNWNDGVGFVPIGSSTEAFTGTLSGNNHTIDNLYINRPDDYIGLFGVSNSSITNVNLLDVYVTGGTNAGALIGWNQGNGVITNSYSKGNIYGNDTSGGLVAINNGMISNSSSAGQVFAGNTAGGLVGHSFNGGQIVNSYSTVDVARKTTNSKYVNYTIDGYIGGLVGNNDAKISGSYFIQGNVSGSGNTNPVNSKGHMGLEESFGPSWQSNTQPYQGHWVCASWQQCNFKKPAIVNHAYSVTLLGCNNNPTDSSSSATYIRDCSENTGTPQYGATHIKCGADTAYNDLGIAGDSVTCKPGEEVVISSDITKGQMIGAMQLIPTGTNSASGNIGGLVGWNRGNGYITNSYAMGVINGAVVGGLVGTNDGVVSQSYAAAKLAANLVAGGLVGQLHGGSIQNSYYDSEVSGQHDTGKGTPKTTEEMMQQNTFVGWDFVNIWQIDSGKGYPWLRWQNDKNTGYNIILDQEKSGVRRPASELFRVDY